MKVISRKEREKERRKDLILSAAEEVFRRHGYEGTTMEQVADEAEFSKGTLYLYFGSKFALFAELSNRVLTKILSEFQTLVKEPPRIPHPGCFYVFCERLRGAKTVAVIRPSLM